MFIAGLLLFSTSLLNVKPAPVFSDVYVGDQGPYRFLVDTGAQTSLIDPKLAAQLQLKPGFRIEVVTQNSTRLLPGMKINTLRIGQTRLHDVEIVFHELTQARRLDPAIMGVLGVNALAGLDFTLCPRDGKLELANQRPKGTVLPFIRIEDRIAIQARMGRETLTLILDSGATHIVLFHTPEAMAKSPALRTTFGTLEGARRSVPTCWTADMSFANTVKFGMLPAAIVSRPGAQADGLLPASLFKSVYVDQDRGEVVLVR